MLQNQSDTYPLLRRDEQHSTNENTVRHELEPGVSEAGGFSWSQHVESITAIKGLLLLLTKECKRIKLKSNNMECSSKFYLIIMLKDEIARYINFKLFKSSCWINLHRIHICSIKQNLLSGAGDF